MIDLLLSRLGEDRVDLAELLASRAVLPPVDHPEPAHCYVTGTGLTHLGSASTRDGMHKMGTETSAEELTDTIRMFRLGLEGGKPKPGQEGVQPEWFYKGNGDSLVSPEHAFPAPGFGLDLGEEPELVGLYVIAQDGRPCRIGFALGNELSDHVTERKNYLYLAHSKLRSCSFGPELLLGELPADIRGTTRIIRGAETLWEADFLTGEANMSHSIANLEYHHFKYDIFRRPGDLHCHFMGTATMSFSAGVTTQPGDRFAPNADAVGAGGRVLCQQFSIGIFGGRWRYGFSPGRGKSSDRQSAQFPSRDSGTGRQGRSQGGPTVEHARGPFLAPPWGRPDGGSFPGAAPGRCRGRFHRFLPGRQHALVVA